MIIAYEPPGPWQSFTKRRDNIGLSVMEMKQKYTKEQLLFEGYLQQLNTVNTLSAGAAGGPAPSTGGGGDEFPGIKLKIDTQYNFPEIEYGTYNQGRGITTEDVFLAVIDNDEPGYDVTIDWGDGNIEGFTSTNFFLDAGFGQRLNVIRHTYDVAGEYDVIITGDGAYDIKPSIAPIVDITYFNVNTSPNALDYVFHQNNFQGMSEETKTIISNWDTSHITTLRGAFTGIDQFRFWNFRSASDDVGTFTEPLPNVEGWDVSNVTSLDLTFSGRAGFNQNLGSWDVGNVEGLLNTFQNNLRLMSGARADLWNYSPSGQWYQTVYGTFENSMTDVSVVGSMPHVGNWDLSNISDGSGNYFYNMFKGSGFSHTAVGETLIGWASQSVIPENIGVASSAFENTFNGTYSIGGGPQFSNPTYNTGTAFGLEVSASFSLLTTPTSSGGYGWTIPGFTFS